MLAQVVEASVEKGSQGKKKTNKEGESVLSPKLATGWFSNETRGSET